VEKILPEKWLEKKEETNNGRRKKLEEDIQ